MAEILITGTSAGIGFLTALAFGHAGDHVIAGVRDPSSAIELEAEIRAHRLTIDVATVDVTDPTSIKEFVEYTLDTCRIIDVLVNNAAVAFAAAVEDSDDQRTASVMDTNFLGPLRLMRAVLPHLRAQRHGHIINISTSARTREGRPFAGVYAASKAALDALSVSLIEEVAPFGIGVTIVEPGSFHTAIDQKFVAGLRASEAYPGRAEAVVARRDRAASNNVQHVADAVVHAAHTHPPPRRIGVPD